MARTMLQALGDQIHHGKTEHYGDQLRRYSTAPAVHPGCRMIVQKRNTYQRKVLVFRAVGPGRSANFKGENPCCATNGCKICCTFIDMFVSDLEERFPELVMPA